MIGMGLDILVDLTLSGPVPQVPWAAGYDSTNLDTTMFHPVGNSWGSKYLIPDMVPPLLSEGDVPLT
jgi:hypothetical protein